MRTRLALLCLMLFIPMLASASTFGFPREPLWVSSSTGVAGESITMYAAVYNASADDLKGTVSFMADGTVFDTKSIDLPTGNSSLVTDAWTASQGTHSLSAQFASGDETDATQKITVTIAAAPPQPPAPPSIVDKATSELSTLTSTVAAPNSVVGTVANAVVSTTENIRQAGADAVKPYTAAATAAPATTGTAASAPKSTTAKPTIVQSVTQTAAAAAFYTFDTQWLFYALAIVLLYLILRVLKRWVSRPRF